MTFEDVDVNFQIEVEILPGVVNLIIDYLLEDLKVVKLSTFILSWKPFCQEINPD